VAFIAILVGLKMKSLHNRRNAICKIKSLGAICKSHVLGNFMASDTLSVMTDAVHYTSNRSC
jgi:hypothetical protein